MRPELTCAILAGGLGTRLRAAVQDVPKPMARVAGRPFLEFLLAQAALLGCKNVVLCIGYKGRFMEDYFGDGRKYGVRIRYSREENLAGTAGALAFARDLIHSDPFLVMNGDSYCDLEIAGFCAHHNRTKALATVLAVRASDSSRYGRIIFGDRDVVLGFEEKSTVGGSAYVNAGIYLFNLSVVDLIAQMGFSSVELELFPFLVGRGIFAYRSSGLFIDIGTPLDLQRAEDIIKQTQAFESLGAIDA